MHTLDFWTSISNKYNTDQDKSFEVNIFNVLLRQIGRGFCC